MLFDITDDKLEYSEIFDEFPGISAHSLEYTACFCGETKGQLLADTTRHRNFQPVIACAKCGSLRANPYFTADTVSHYYGEVYGPVKRKDEPAEQLQARQRVASLAPFLEPHLDHVDSILDFGGGAGGRVLDLMDGKRTVALFEVEGTYSAAGYAAGLAHHEPGRRYDLVVVSHVIEHLLDPTADIAKVIAEHCQPDGYLLVATPIIDRVKARKWLRLLHIAHKYYFTHDALIGLIGSLGGTMVAEDGVDTYLFRLGAPVAEPRVRAAYARGAAMTRRAVAGVYRQRLLREMFRRLAG